MIPRKIWTLKSLERRPTTLTTENVDEDALNLWVGDKNLKCFLDGVRGGASE